MLSYMILWITRAQFDTGRSLWLDLWPWSPSTYSSPSFNVDAVFPRPTFKIIRSSRPKGENRAGNRDRRATNRITNV